MRKEEVEDKIRNFIQIDYNSWSKDPRGIKDPHVANELGNCQNQMDNFDEVVSIYYAERLHWIVDMVKRKVDVIKEKNSIKDLMMEYVTEEQLDMFKHVLEYPEAIRNYFVQTCYNQAGFKGLLPTNEEIAKLKQELNLIKSNGATSKETLPIEREIKLKECAIGKGGINEGLPYQLSNDINAYYDDREKDLELSTGSQVGGR